LSVSFPRTIFGVLVTLADILTQIDQHDTEPRTQNAAQQAITQTSTNFWILRSKNLAAMQQKEQESAARNGQTPCSVAGLVATLVTLWFW